MKSPVLNEPSNSFLSAVTSGPQQDNKPTPSFVKLVPLVSPVPVIQCDKKTKEKKKKFELSPTFCDWFDHQPPRKSTTTDVPVSLSVKKPATPDTLPTSSFVPVSVESKQVRSSLGLRPGTSLICATDPRSSSTVITSDDLAPDPATAKTPSTDNLAPDPKNGEL